MADYKGEPCPVCEQIFKEGDDIVVCPECGTPYHRACWAKVGHCVHEAEHAAGFEWKPAAHPHSEPAAAAETVCPNCGTANPTGATRCAHCGVPLPGPEPSDDRPIYARDEAPRQQSNEPRISAYAAGSDGGIYRRELGPDDAIDGIKARDWASYVGHSSPFYLMQFFRMSVTRRRMGVSLSAFVLGPVYFFYRKMWQQAIVFTVLSLLTEVPAVLALLAGAGVAPVAGWPLGWLPTVMDVAYIGGWVLRVLMGLFAVYWYKQEAGRRIKDIYARIPEGPARADALALTGGTSLPAALLYVVAYLALATALAAVVGPYVQTLLYDMAL